MKQVDTLIKRFKTKRDCLNALDNLYNEKYTCKKCSGKEFYKAKDYKDTFKLICKSCKTIILPTVYTPLHNVRFGLLKAFHIYIEIKYNDIIPKSTYLAKKYNITQKTAWTFKKRVIESNWYIDLSEYSDKNQLTNLDNLRKFLANNDKTKWKYNSLFNVD